MKINLPRRVTVTLLGLLLSTGTALAEQNPASKSTAGNKNHLSFEQIKTAAQGGDPDAQYALGYMFYYGKDGATKDNVEAKRWIAKAAAQKQSQAVKALALMNRQQESASSGIQSRQPTPDVNREPTSLANTDKQETRAKTNEPMTLVDMRNEPKPRDNHEVVPARQETSSAQSEGGAFTLQLLGAYQKDQVAKMIESHHLDAKAGIYQTTHNNKDWYVLLYGRYKTKEEAHSAAKKLEQELAVKPWVKPYSTIKTYKKL